MYFVKTPKVIKSIFRDVVWSIPNLDNKVYLTFDDGPTEGITDKALAILKEHNAIATFFCLGQQVEKNLLLYREIKESGHAVGNHSYSHLKGWLSNNDNYFEDVKKAADLIESQLFRPPYGKAKRSQLSELKKQYKIVMWDVLPGDFSPKTSVESVVSNTIKNVRSGSVIVLHDNDKCGDKMLEALPKIITSLKEKGFVFDVISK